MEVNCHRHGGKFRFTATLLQMTIFSTVIPILMSLFVVSPLKSYSAPKAGTFGNVKLHSAIIIDILNDSTCNTVATS